MADDEILTILDDYPFLTKAGVSIYRASFRPAGSPEGLAAIVKRPRPGVAVGEVARAFDRQYRAMRDAGSYVCPAPLYLGAHGKSLVFVTEDRGGMMLADRLAKGPLGVQDALDIGLGITKAMASLHKAGWHHRDLNPDNVLIDASGAVLFVDLDNARAIGDESHDDYAPPLSPRALSFVAPEQTGRTALPVDWRCDVYSIGAVLYAMIAGHPPFEGATRAAVLHDCMAGIAPSPGSLVEGVPPLVDAIIQKAMDKDPSRRYSTLYGLAADLAAARAGVESWALGARENPRAMLSGGDRAVSYADVALMVAEAFAPLDRRTDSLAAAAFAASGGDPERLTAFLESLASSGDIRFDPPRGAWTMAEGLAAAGSAFVQALDAMMPERLESLGDGARLVLEYAACSGADIDAEAIKAVSGRTDAAAALDEAAAAGLIVPSRAGTAIFHYSHDRIRERIYGGMPAAKRNAMHRALAAWFGDRGRPLVAAEHVMAAAKNAEPGMDEEASARILSASSKALADEDPERALDMAATACSILGPEAWDRSHDLALELRLRLMEAAAAAGRYPDFARAAAEARASARPADAVRIDETAIRGLIGLGHTNEAIDIGIGAFRRLDFPVPADPGIVRAVGSYAAAFLRLSTRSDESLLSAKPLADGDAAQALSIIAALGPSVYSHRPKLVPVIAALAVRICTSLGNDPKAALMFASMALIAQSTFRDYGSARRFSQLAERYSSMAEGMPGYAQTRYIVSSFVARWTRPTRAILDALLDAGRVGKATGEHEYASFSYMAFLQHSILIGRPLAAIAADLPEVEESVRSMKNELAILMLDASLAALTMLRSGDDPTTQPALRGATFAEWEARLVAEDQNTLACDIAIYRAFVDYTFSRYEDAREALEGVRGCLDSYRGQFPYSTYVTLDGLVATKEAIEAHRRGDGALRRRSIRKLTLATRQLAVWKRRNPGIFDAKETSLRASLLFWRDRTLASFDLFEHAITVAKHAGNYLDELTLCSAYAQCLFDSGREPLADFYMHVTYDALVKWGAIASAEALSYVYPPLREWISQTPALEQSGGLRVVDAEALIQASRALSGELDTNRLLETLLGWSMRITGARSAVAWLKRDDAWSPGAFQGFGKETVAPTASPERAARLEAVLEGAVTCTESSRSEWGSRAFVPLMGRAASFGVLELSNELVTDAFPAERLNLVEAITSQACVSLDNAELYGGLERKVRERTKELEDALKRVRRLRGLIPICSSCKKVRDDKGYWRQVEEYISANSDADFTHGLCPDCLERYYDQMNIPKERRKAARND